MNDDWRLQVDLDEDGHAEALTDRLEARELEHDLKEEFHDRVVVTRNGARLFLYAGTRDQAERGREVVEADAKEHGWKAQVELRHWHPTALDWEDPDEPLPADDAARLAEHQTVIAREREETEKNGYPQYEVRVDLPSRDEAIEFAERLRKEGLPNVQRWKFVLVGATDEDAAAALAERIGSEAPADGQVKVEGSWIAAYGEMPPNPFSFLGGLAY